MRFGKKGDIMKRKTLAGLTLVLVLFFGPLGIRANALKFRIFGGGNYLQGGDLNRGLQGWTDYWKANWNAQGRTQKSGAFNPIHLGLNVGADIIFQLSPNWGVGLGTELVMASKSSALVFQSSNKIINWDILGKVSTIPVKLSVFYSLPIKDSLTLVFHAGAGYYSAKTRLESRQDFDSNIEYIIDCSAAGIGFHGGLGLEMKLSKTVNLFIEGTGRYASLSGFTGKVMIDGQNSWDGKLFYWEAKTSFIDNYGYIDLLGNPPGGANVKFVRDAKIDFSGFSLRAGILINL